MNSKTKTKENNPPHYCQLHLTLSPAVYGELPPRLFISIAQSYTQRRLSFGASSYSKYSGKFNSSQKIHVNCQGFTFSQSLLAPCSQP